VLCVARRQQRVVRAVARRLLFLEVLWQLQCTRQDTDSRYTSIRVCEYRMAPCMNRQINVYQYLAISPYNKEHYFVAFRDRSIQYNFTGAPPEWMRLMREVFDAWTAERTQPQQPLTPTPNALYSQVQAYQQQPASCYYSNTTVESPCSPTTPLAPPTPVTPNTPLSEHASLGLPNSQRNSMYAHKQSSAYVQPPIAAIELPVELPGDTLLAAPAPVPVTSAPSEVSCSPLLQLGALLTKRRKGENSSLEYFDTRLLRRLHISSLSGPASYLLGRRGFFFLIRRYPILFFQRYLCQSHKFRQSLIASAE
jgi:hypothetical protein